MASESKVWIPLSLPPQHPDYKPKPPHLTYFTWVLGGQTRSLYRKAYRQNCLRGPYPLLLRLNPGWGPEAICVFSPDTHKQPGQAQGAAL